MIHSENKAEAELLAQDKHKERDKKLNAALKENIKRRKAPTQT